MVGFWRYFKIRDNMQGTKVQSPQGYLWQTAEVATDSFPPCGSCHGSVIFELFLKEMESFFTSGIPAGLCNLLGPMG
jgi:hypothetical protein